MLSKFLCKMALNEPSVNRPQERWPEKKKTKKKAQNWHWISILRDRPVLYVNKHLANELWAKVSVQHPFGDVRLLTRRSRNIQNFRRRTSTLWLSCASSSILNSWPRLGSSPEDPWNPLSYFCGHATCPFRPSNTTLWCSRVDDFVGTILLPETIWVPVLSSLRLSASPRIVAYTSQVSDRLRACRILPSRDWTVTK